MTEKLLTKLLTIEEVAGYVGVPVTTVYQWRTKGTGPRGVKVGRHVRFRHADVEAWLERHTDSRPAA